MGLYHLQERAHQLCAIEDDEEGYFCVIYASKDIFLCAKVEGSILSRHFNFWYNKNIDL